MAVIVGRNAEAVAAAAAKWGWAESATDWREVIARDDIDIVDIVTPGDSHAEIAIAALEAGKHVLCEKPLANTVAEAEAMADAAARAAARGIRAMVGFTYRRVPAVTFLRDLIAEGAVGPDQPGACGVPAGLARRSRDAAGLAPAEGARRFGRAGRHRRARIDLAQFVTGLNAREGVGRHRHDREGAAAAGSGSGLSGTAARRVRRGHRRRRRHLHRPLRSGALGSFEATRFATGRKNALRDRGLGRQGRARVRPRGPQQPAVLRPHRAATDARASARSWSPRRSIPTSRRGGPPATCSATSTGSPTRSRTSSTAIVDGTDPHPTFAEGLQVQRVLDAVERSSARTNPPGSASPSASLARHRSEGRERWRDRSPCSPASGPTCRSRRWRGSPASGATTASRSPAGATTSTRGAGTTTPTCRVELDILERNGLKVWAISNHLKGQAVCDDPIDERHRDILLGPRVGRRRP